MGGGGGNEIEKTGREILFFGAWEKTGRFILGAGFLEKGLKNGGKNKQKKHGLNGLLS